MGAFLSHCNNSKESGGPRAFKKEDTGKPDGVYRCRTEKNKTTKYHPKVCNCFYSAKSTGTVLTSFGYLQGRQRVAQTWHKHQKRCRLLISLNKKAQQPAWQKFFPCTRKHYHASCSYSKPHIFKSRTCKVWRQANGKFIKSFRELVLGGRDVFVAINIHCRYNGTQRKMHFSDPL